MHEMSHARYAVTGDLDFLGYAIHMAQAAQCDSAKRMFLIFAQQERRRLVANGGVRLLAPRHEPARARTRLPSVFEIGPVSLTPAGSRVERTGTMRQRPRTTMDAAMKNATGRMGKRVSFEVSADPGSEVFVAGSFNGWNPAQYRMRDNPGSGHCKITILLPPGRHEYKFVVNGEWRADPNCADSTPNNHGSMNSVISV